MKAAAFRGVALLLLAFSLLSWSGLAAAAAFVQAQPADACCDRAGEEEEAPSSCSPQECPCFSCLPFEAVESFPSSPAVAAARSLIPLSVSVHPLDLVRAIDYPPEPS